MSSDPYEDFMDAYRPKLSATHNSKVTTCLCLPCKRLRGTGFALQAQSEAVRWILYLKWLRWVMKKDRKDWPAVHTANPAMLAKAGDD